MSQTGGTHTLETFWLTYGALTKLQGYGIAMRLTSTWEAIKARLLGLQNGTLMCLI